MGATFGFFALIALLSIPKMVSLKGSTNGAQPSSRSKDFDQHPRLFSDVSEIPRSLLMSLDAVLILGGGVPESISHPPKYVERRCDDAIQVSERFHQEVAAMLQQQQPQQPQQQRNSSKRTVRRQESGLPPPPSSPPPSLPMLCLSAGTAHLPQLLATDGLPIWESTACAAYLAEHGPAIDPWDIYVETTSYDTIGNAFYTRTTHTDLNGWRRLLVITNEFHMDRTRAIFDWIFSLPSAFSPPAGAASKKRNAIDDGGGTAYDLFYLQSPNVGLTKQAVAARKEREASSARTVRERLAPEHATSLRDVYQFLTHDHSLYAAQRLVDRGRGGGDDAKASTMVRQSYGAKST